MASEAQLRQQAEKEKQATAEAAPEEKGGAAEGNKEQRGRTSTGRLLKSFVSSVVEGVQVATGATKPKPFMGTCRKK